VSEYLPPMAGGQDRRIAPGPVRGGACPPPSEIVVVETRKVFDFCFQEDSLERCFFVSGLTNGATISGCEITNVTCSEILDREPIPEQDGLALVSLQINIEITVTIQPGTVGATPITVMRTISFPKRVVLCAPTGTDVTCDVRGTCICTMQPPSMNQVGQVGTEPNVCCTIQLCVVVQSTALVKILVPSFGVVMPQECRVSPAFGGCPPMPPEVCGPGINMSM
jgi:hypothetical protein